MRKILSSLVSLVVMCGVAEAAAVESKALVALNVITNCPIKPKVDKSTGHLFTIYVQDVVLKGDLLTVTYQWQWVGGKVLNDWTTTTTIPVSKIGKIRIQNAAGVYSAEVIASCIKGECITTTDVSCTHLFSDKCFKVTKKKSDWFEIPVCDGQSAKATVNVINILKNSRR